MAQSTLKSVLFALYGACSTFVVLGMAAKRATAFEQFDNIRKYMCSKEIAITEGKMMSSPAIHYKNRVFAFFSRKNKMVFKLGKEYTGIGLGVQLEEFSPFKTKKTLSGWYEVGFDECQKWEMLALKALEYIKS
ncbi:hypothetical protein [Maribacter sp. 2304DJ31-5]|uniref:hypothetical protein n=1 Tax=Maribacter sp. 2304DJ31-5 TaxID=3386273 RepID=UPI0039BCDC99